MLTLLLCLQEIDNPEYQAWAKYKPASYVAYKVTTDAGTGPAVVEQFHELVSLSAEKAVVRTKTRSHVNTGEATIEVGGHKIPCLWTEKQYEDGSYSKTYTSPSMPGNLVVLNQDIAGVKTEIIVTKFGIE